MKKLVKHYLVTEVFISGLKKNADTFPEYSHAKEMNYYIFGDNVESYTTKIKLQSICVLLVLIKERECVT